MEHKKLKELLNILKESGLEEVSLRTKDYSLRIKRSPRIHEAMPAPVAAPAPAPEKKEGPQPAQEESRYHTLRAPMIGTFYRSPDPKEPPFVKEGDTVAVGQTVCIIEAMKLFNEVEVDVAGRVVKVLVENTTAVAYDEPLMLIDPS